MPITLSSEAGDMVETRKVAREDIEKELSELESYYSMPTSDFIMAFRNGRLDENPDFRKWAHLSTIRSLFERGKAHA
jgi:hypothetical protein